MGYEHIPGAVSGAPVAAYLAGEAPGFGRPLGKEFRIGVPAASHQPAALWGDGGPVLGSVIAFWYQQS